MCVSSADGFRQPNCYQVIHQETDCSIRQVITAPLSEARGPFSNHPSFSLSLPGSPPLGLCQLQPVEGIRSHGCRGNLYHPSSLEGPCLSSLTFNSPRCSHISAVPASSPLAVSAGICCSSGGRRGHSLRVSYETLPIQASRDRFSAVSPTVPRENSIFKTLQGLLFFFFFFFYSRSDQKYETVRNRAILKSILWNLHRPPLQHQTASLTDVSTSTRGHEVGALMSVLLQTGL